MGAACYKGRGGYGSHLPAAKEGLCDKEAAKLDRKQNQNLLVSNTTELEAVKVQPERKTIATKDKRTYALQDRKSSSDDEGGQKEKRKMKGSLKEKQKMTGNLQEINQNKKRGKLANLTKQCQAGQTYEIEAEIHNAKEKEKCSIKQKEKEKRKRRNSEVEEQVTHLVAASATFEVRPNAKLNDQVANEEAEYMNREKDDKAVVEKEIAEKYKKSPHIFLVGDKTVEKEKKTTAISITVTTRSGDVNAAQEATKKEDQISGENTKMEYDSKKVVNNVETSRKKYSNTTLGANAEVNSTTQTKRSKKKKILGGKVGKLEMALNLNAFIGRSFGSSHIFPDVRSRSNPSPDSAIEKNKTTTASIKHHLKPKMAGRSSRSKSKWKTSLGTLKKFSPKQTWISRLEQPVDASSASSRVRELDVQT
mmetsp:Transcript_10955/g.15194  ORF Transcript_10955/g.15194 Transcript_10955/m.15194 type:complete len:421 (+) Transcript_10955:370-1632(+)|eukprot:CAMPEP_0185254374 /NCGR_PEP_ID=MMETSP1359-20130426/3148_1 /TAXON_ID=552665 /ORGANISM="Bigelowiella longifila, Strain CCMP242" /LENGTH=420 /DNA_ID=CAMNT_0027837327 /DNA_START=358 /DNA_END=1620 /DNA_ORIENTATION=-